MKKVNTLSEFEIILNDIGIIELSANLYYQSDDKIINILYEMVRDLFIEINPNYFKINNKKDGDMKNG